MPAPHISQWLSQALGSYRTRDAVQRDVELALDTYPSLKIKTDQYTYDDGRTLLLLCIHGTLPITYAGARYNVPIHCWLPLESPREPPIVYVVPTSTMLVRKGNGVALDGRVEDTETSYLGRWRRKPEAHSLLSLLQTLVDAFSAAPPVYAKPKAATPQSSSPASPTASSSTSNPPRLGSQQAARSESLPTYSRPPPLPPLPPQTPPMGGHHTSQGSMSPLGGPPAPQLPLGGASGSPVARPPWPPGAAPGAGFGYQSPPPPPLPPTSPTGSVTSQNQQPPYSGHRIPYPGQQPPPRMPSTDPPSGPGWATPSPPLPGWQGHHQQRESIGGGGPPPPQIPGTLHAFSQQQQPYRPPPPPLTAQLQQPFPSSFLSTGPPPPSVQALPPPIPTPSTRPPVASTPSVPIPDLLSAASPPPSPSAEKSALPSAGPPPPPPPNPELLLLHSHLHSHLSAARDATLNSLQTRRHRLSQIRADLASAEPAIEDEKARLGAVRDVCLGVGDRMRGSVKELEARVAMLEQRGEISVDEVVCSTTIVYNQLIDLVAEDAALSDALYQLSRALHADRIDITRFLKQARVLAREQFLKRALVERILSGGGKVPTGSG